jgi:hypothetical protein
MKLNRQWFTILLLASSCLLAVLPTLTFAQTTTTGELSGSVTDSSGAVLSKATVALKSVDTGSSQSTQTNATGSYKFALLQPGAYVVSGAASGFKGSEKRIQISLGGSAAVNLQLAVGTSSVTVEVSAVLPEAHSNPYRKLRRNR